jgi:hypothetical protein
MIVQKPLKIRQSLLLLKSRSLDFEGAGCLFKSCKFLTDDLPCYEWNSGQKYNNFTVSDYSGWNRCGRVEVQLLVVFMVAPNFFNTGNSILSSHGMLNLDDLHIIQLSKKG